MKKLNEEKRLIFAAMREQGQVNDYGFFSVNRYGALCLNSNRVMFGDIDCKAETPEQQAERETKAIEIVTAEAVVGLARFRVYKTFAGLRLIETSRTWEPRAATTLAFLRSLQCDEIYVLLTERCNNFRVRLTPKPWRTCGHFNFHKRHGVGDYLRKPQYRIAIYRCTVGTAVPDSSAVREIESVVRVHDQYCHVNKELPLA